MVPFAINRMAWIEMLAPSLARPASVHAPVSDEQLRPVDEDDDNLAPARGILLGAFLGTICLLALALLLWWAF
jgi:hypothetical protein